MFFCYFLISIYNLQIGEIFKFKEKKKDIYISRKSKRQDDQMERKYTNVSHHNHVLLRPDSYVGSVKPRTEERWLCKKMSSSFELVSCKSRPACQKLFDEILLNACDNSRIPNNPTKKIRIVLTKESIQVENDGQCIPIKKQDGMYIPEMVFFKLLTSEHYDDKKERISAGLNGYGSKLTAIFSTKVSVDCFDPGRKLFFHQEYRKNMKETDGPIVKKKKSNKYTVRYTYTPDTQYFPKWNNKTSMALYRRRVADVAACFPKVKFYLNEEEVKTSFKKYIGKYTTNKSTTFEFPNWTIGLALSSTEAFQQISFVNGIRTSKGGTHIDAMLNQITSHIQTILRKRHKKSTTKLSKKNIMQRLFLFINCTVRNPHFGSQTKEEMTTEVDTPTLSLKAVEKAIKTSGILTELEVWLESKELNSLNKKMRGTQKKTIKGIPKLNDAQKAGTSESKKCHLILTEGDSAASTAIAGLTVVGRKYYGVMPLKGKMLNVRGKSASVLSKNKEIQDLIKILGLQLGRTYTDTSSLRYGKIIVMADQDVDGFHISGLLLNFIEHFWPSLTRLGYIQRFITPLIKIGNREFFSITAYETWREQNPSNHQKVKYYKGLGTSTNKEAKQYFTNLRKYVKEVYFDEFASENLQLVFDGNFASQRKIWMNKEVQMIDYSVPRFTVKDIIMPELLEYSKSTLYRAIPKLVDNLKQAQRKILFAAFKKVRTKEMKVAQLAAYTADVSEYTHGETSLCQAIIKMAQDYPGSNALPLLQPNGQFGSILQNGGDAASPRYIFTQLQPYTENIFHPDDLSLLTTLIEEGTPVEPQFYVPILPMLLVNGASGIATGWRTNILPCNLKEIISNLRRLLRKEPIKHMKPFVKGYKGTISEEYLSSGLFELKGNHVDITQLPLGVSVLQYKTFLHGCSFVTKFDELHPNEREVHFRVTLSEVLANPYKQLKLERQLGKSLVTLDLNGNIQSFNSPDEILIEFFKIRMDYYHRRKTYLLSAYERQIKELEWETIFIQRVITNPRQPNLEGIPQNHLDKFRKMSISRLETQNINKCKETIDQMKVTRATLEQTTAENLYERDLNVLYEKLFSSKKRKR